ncbi:MAG: hypothetical protein GX860_08810 [Alcaligenaceae bacterium]|jgi:cytochrome c553|nr:hypothetical protein [Alcaligenaceae bacterium]
MKNSVLTLIAFGLMSMASISQVHSKTKNNEAIFDATALAYACLNCHSPNAVTHNGDRLAIPNILNQDAEATYQLLVAYQQDELPPNTTIMNRLLAAFNDEELKAIAEAVSKIDLEQQ